MTPTLAALRFGTGLSPDIAPPADVGEMRARLAGPDEMARDLPLPGWSGRMVEFSAYQQVIRDTRDLADREARADLRKAAREGLDRAYLRDLAVTVVRGAMTRDGLRERLVWFWTGHFAVQEGQGLLRRTVGGHVEDAIRPYVARSFADLLKAAVTHPAMLRYLDQDGSTGPNSVRARRGGGLNENLAREVLELHTLGVGGAYGQGDVRQLAELFTGMSVGKDGAYEFRRNMAEPGAETVLGRAYGDETPNRHDITQVLGDLAVHPDTARHVSGKLARHFVADTPPEALVAAMSATWIESGGDLMAVYGAMLDHPEAWGPQLRKVRRPLDLIVATVRATGGAERLLRMAPRDVRRGLQQPLERMGQPFLRPEGPDGWPEEAEAWITPQALAARLDWAMEAASRLDPAPDPRAFVEMALAEQAGPRTLFAAEAAEDRRAGVGLVLASPEFQRR